MKKLIMIAIMAIGVFSLSEANAQKVIKDTGGKVYIDVQDMPSETWSNATLNSTHDEASATNKLFKRFEVDKSDLPKAVWATAKTNCSNKGTGWRLPTQRELLLIGIMQDALVSAGVGVFVKDVYWSNTQNAGDVNYAWGLNFNTNGMNGPGKTTSLNVRCIREV